MEWAFPFLMLCLSAAGLLLILAARKMLHFLSHKEGVSYDYRDNLNMALERLERHIPVLWVFLTVGSLWSFQSLLS